MRERNCSWCAAQLPADAGNARKFCNNLCKERARYQRRFPREVGSCLWCGEQFITAGGKRKFCGRRCNQNYAWRLAHPQVERDCARCGKRIADGKRTSAIYCDRVCKNQAVQARRRTNGPEQREKDRQRYLREREHRIAYAVAYAAKNPHIGQAAKRNRKAAAGTGRFSSADWSRLCRRHHGCCVYCGERKPLTVDHVVPLVRGGSNTIGNILPACRSCNSRKQGRFIMEWRLGLSRRTSRRADAVDAIRAG